MDIMEFKIAVINSKMYGDFSVISDHERQSIGIIGSRGHSLEKKSKLYLYYRACQSKRIL